VSEASATDASTHATFTATTRGSHVMSNTPGGSSPAGTRPVVNAAASAATHNTASAPAA
jgi:hypothetical protein